MNVAMRWPSGMRVLVLTAAAGCTPVPAVPLDGDAAGPRDAAADASDSAADANLAANIVFVTSTKQTGGSLGSLAGADAICNARAAAAGLPGTYVAWLSSGSVAARDRLGTARGWVRVDGQPVVDTQGALVNGRLWYPPMLDEMGAAVRDIADGALTNTLYDGTPAGMDCSGWTSTTGTTTYGAPSGATRTWTEGSYLNPTTSCGSPMRLYCFGTDRHVTVTPTPQTGSRAFITLEKWYSSTGLADADLQCQRAADQYGISGVFKALLATSTASAASRFDLTKSSPWVRLDGVRLAPTRAAFMASELEAAPSVSVDGRYDNNLPLLWTGTPGTGTSLPTAVSSVDRTCHDWTPVMGDYAGIGWSQIAGPRFFDSAGAGNYYCTNLGGTVPPRLLCLED